MNYLAMYSTVTYTPEPYVVSILVGIVLPLITGVITKLGAGSAVKAAANAVLSVIAGVITNLALNPEIDVYSMLFAIALAFVTSVATHFGFWRPTEVSAKVQASTANFGIGSPQSTGE